MSSPLLKFSLCANLLLLGVAGYLVVTRQPAVNVVPATAQIDTTNASPAGAQETAVATSLRWSDLESDDYATYVANLRKAGCPEPILRRIINADLKDLYAKKAFALVREFHRDFWEISAKQNVQQYYEKTLAPQVKAFCGEPDALLKQLLGDAPTESPTAPAPSVFVSRFADFLSPAKQEQLRDLDERYEPRLQALRHSELPGQDYESQMKQLQADLENDQAQILSPEELAEYHLRQSTAAAEVQHLYGVDFNETELRNMAKALDDYHHRTVNQGEVESETLDQKLQTALGQSRFTDLNRSRAATYREIYDIVSDFGQPAETAAQIFDLRLKSEKQSDDIRSDRNRSADEKQTLLDQLEDQVEQSIRSKMGAGAYQTYKTGNGGWINALGRL